MIFIPSGECGVLLLATTVPVIAAKLRVGQGGNLLLEDLDLSKEIKNQVNKTQTGN